MSSDIGFIGPRPFTVDIPQAAFDETVEAAKSYQVQPYLNNLLTKPIDEEDFTYGIPPNLFIRLLNRLKDGFSWSEWQNKINTMGSHHILTVKGVDAGDDLDVHFVHKCSANPGAIPLLLVHGWPGSFLEFEGIFKLLTDKYHLVCPSIPGYTFSSPPKNLEGSNDPAPLITAQIAQCFDAIMRSLGYNKYVAQGGDWGSILVRRVAHLFPQRCRALRK
jgi:epoxide hydrolase